MNYRKQSVAGLGVCSGLFMLAVLPTALQAQTPVSVTTGRVCGPPHLSKKHFVVSGPLEAVAVPLEGWKVVWPGMAPDRIASVTSGISVANTTAIVRGARLPALRLELTKGAFKRPHPVVELAFPLNAETHNILSFVAKVEVPEDLKPVIRDSTQVMTGYPAGAFNRYFDDFGVAVDDGNFQWAALGVPTTHFRYHDIPETRGEDGFADFRWDMKYHDHTCNKGFVRDRARALRLYYDTRKIPEDRKVVVTIALPKLVKGAHAVFAEPERYAEWTDFVANYQPDYSDSSAELLPPETGRIDKPIRIAQDGKALAEIIIDLSEAIRIDNFFAKDKMNLELRSARGSEVPVARLAANDLRHWVKEITGAGLPVLLSPSKERNAKIFLGATYAKPHFPEDLKKLASGGSSDGFAVRVKDGSIYLFGARPAGTLFGVYAFLENNTDIIWAIAGDPAGTVFDKRPTLDIVWADAIEKPAFIWRGCHGDTLWKRRNSMNVGPLEQGMSKVFGGHYLCPQYYDPSEGIRRFNPVLKRHEGKRVERWSEYRALACLEDPDFIEHAVDFVPPLKDLKYRSSGHCIFGIDDNYGVCECELCSRPFTDATGRVISPETDYAAFYGAWFYRYLNKLDDRIQKEWPGFVTSTFAYFMAAPHPPIEVNKTIVPQLCTYVRKSQEEPIFAPANQRWWKIYQDWSRHTPQLLLYDYWGLGFVMKPRAEVHRFDLQAQRDIGFLRNYSEGFGACEYLGVADERWCMAKLDWNPDLDVEKLHRRFNRRTYREAAPWIDKFRGTIRENYYQRANRSIDFEESRELVTMIRDLGLEAELRSYLDKALKAVKHPSSKILIEKMIADFEYYVNGPDGWAFPSKKKGSDDPLAQAASIAWSKNRGVSRPDGRPQLTRVFSHGRGFDIACPVEKPAEAEVAFSFRAPAGVFTFAGYPSVALSGKKKTACVFTWKDNDDGTHTCTVRPPANAGAVNGFTFAFPADQPRWLGRLHVTLEEIAFEKLGSKAPKPGPQDPPFMRTPEYKALLAAIADNQTETLAAMATNAASPSVRLFAAMEASRRGRSLGALLEPSLGKMEALGVVWAPQLQPAIDQHLKEGAYTVAIPWLREQLASEGLSGKAEAASPALANLVTCTLEASGAGEVGRLLSEMLAGLEARPNAAFQIYRSFIPVVASDGKTGYAIKLLREALADRRVADHVRHKFLAEHALPSMIEGAKPLPPAMVMELFREYCNDDVGRVIGWSKVAGKWSRDISRLARAYAARDDPKAASEVYDAWINWDGDQLPVGRRVPREAAAVSFFRDQAKRLDASIRRLTAEQAKRPDSPDTARRLALERVGRELLEPELKQAVSRWYASLRECSKNGADPRTRGEAFERLMIEEWDRKNRAQKIADIDHLVFDKFMYPKVRMRATERIPMAYLEQDGATNWRAAADHVIRAIADGDWSANGRNAYWRSRRQDLRLDALCKVAEQVMAADAKDVAKSMLERGAPLLGYTSETTHASEPGTSEADMRVRLDKLDAMMAKCGAKRPPSVKK